MVIFRKEVKENFTIYSKVVNGLKFVSKKFIYLEPGKVGHKNWNLGKEALLCVLGNNGTVRIRQSKSQLADYGFQVFIDRFEKAILRFDADGSTHYDNENDNLTLLEREIRTPHFHKFNNEGKEIAYRTKKLSEFEFEIQNDIQLGFDLFCEENYIEHNKSEKIEIKTQIELFPEEVSNDVNKGVNFP